MYILDILVSCQSWFLYQCKITFFSPNTPPAHLISHLIYDNLTYGKSLVPTHAQGC